MMTKQMLRKIIGENIKRERTARNLSVEELAGLMGITPAYVGLIERGERGTTVHNISKLSEIFSLSFEKFVQSGDGLSFGEDKTSSLNSKRN